MITSRIGGLTVALLAAGALVAGCGSSSDTASDTTAKADTATAVDTSTGQKVGGTATCDAASIEKAAQDSPGFENQKITLEDSSSFKCADGWAYAFINAGTGDEAITATVVFEAEGQFWIPKDRATVCTAPGDQVPAAIYQPACETN
ncbi:MAG: hypothetical protein FJW99_07515 [Actinobacteria bacterium]|nr:hypothetical protein [Actinomycetota bacterium]MBM3696951.1 hypothetical protein [Actinomycetota bacterium]